MSCSKSSNPTAAFGLLGLGYLGQFLAPYQGPGSFTLSRPQWDWAKPADWEQLPPTNLPLILTIPPCHAKLEEERQHLQAFGEWMRQNRPQLQRLVYISATNVYPEAPGRYHETSPLGTDSPKGNLRCLTESLFSDYFDLKVIRAGAIYGPGRNLVTRGQSLGHSRLPLDKRISRIHVEDLARIAFLAATEAHFPALVNAVDLEPATGREVFQWAAQQGWNIPTLSPDTAGALERSIVPQALQEYGYQWIFPSFRQGLAPINDEPDPLDP